MGYSRVIAWGSEEAWPGVRLPRKRQLRGVIQPLPGLGELSNVAGSGFCLVSHFAFICLGEPNFLATALPLTKSR